METDASEIMSLDGGFDVYCKDYFRHRTRIALQSWYDVAPYSLTVWPQYYSELLRYAPWWAERRQYRSFCMEMVLEGEVVYVSGGRRERVRQGEVFVTLPGTNLRYESGSTRQAHQIQLTIEGSVLPLLCETLGMRENRKVALDGPGEWEQMRSWLDRVAVLMKEHRLEQARENSRLGYEIVQFLAEKYRAAEPGELPSVLSHAVRYMAADIACRIGVEELAKQLSVSHDLLNLLFRKHLHTTPQAYWNRLRMNRAIEYVRGSSLSFKEISELMGFRSPLYFSTAFKKFTGLCPSEYRRGKR
ncbi:MAG: helix-turn-helix transcriptional regulator [Victivallales bacterium]|nr:helix-turn-helix transcriptional regulator [Victivallales bacterium]